MKQYILFTEKELDDMLHGEEIEHRLSNGETVYFMCKERFNNDELYEDAVLYTHDITSLIFETKDIAEEVLHTLTQIIGWYGVATVADLCDTVGLANTYNDNKFGWLTLENAAIVEDKHGYLLKLPKAFPIV